MKEKFRIGLQYFANIYSGMSSSQKANERKYLSNLQKSGNDGEKAWASNQLKQLSAAEKADSSSSTSSSSSSSSESSSSSSKKSSSSSSSKKTSSSSSVLDSEGKYHTTVTEKDGTNSSGYIKDGVSYYSDGTPIRAGASVVDSTGRTWTKGGSDSDSNLSIEDYLSKYGVSTSTSNNNDYSERKYEDEEDDYNPYEEAKRLYEEQQKYIREEQEKANKAAIRQGVERLNSQKTLINQSFDEAGKNAYIAKVQGDYALPIQLAASGSTGGMSESTIAKQNANYANQLNDLEKEKINAMNEIETAIVELKNNGNLALAQNNLELAQEYADKIAQLQLQADQYKTASNENDFETWLNTATRYSNDYTAEIQRLQSNTEDPYKDRKIAYLEMLRQQKLDNMATTEAATKEAEAKALKEENEAKMEYAMSLWQTLGYATDDIANILGVPVGAKTADYQNQLSIIANRNSGGSSSGSSSNSNSYAKKAENNGKAINNLYGDILVDYGNGNFSISPDIPRSHYLDLIIARTIDNKNLTDTEKLQFLSSLGIKDDEIDRVVGYYVK